MSDNPYKNFVYLNWRASKNNKIKDNIGIQEVQYQS